MTHFNLHQLDLNAFNTALSNCTGDVYMVTPQGDKLNLKSKLCQLIGFQRLIQTDRIDTAHLHCTNPEDELLFSFLAPCNA